MPSRRHPSPSLTAPSAAGGASSRTVFLALAVGAITLSGFIAVFARFNAISIYLWALNLALVMFVIAQHLRGTHHLVSLRNTFLFGFALFQTQSVADALNRDHYGGLVIRDPRSAALAFSLMATAFLMIFLAVYSRRSAQLVELSKAARVDRIFRSPRSRTGHFLGPVLLTLVAIFLKHLAQALSLSSFQNGVAILSVGTSAAAVGFLGWSWARSPKSILMAAFALALIGANAFAAVGGVFGRRPLVNVLASLLWAMYYSRWRTAKPSRSVSLLLVVGLPPFLLFLLYNSVRDPAEHHRSSSEQLRAIQESGSAAAGLTEVRDKEISGAFTLWSIENFGYTEPRRHLLTLRYMLLLPVPRQLWSDKPVPLSKDFARIADVPGVAPDRITIPAGLIGTSAAEGGWYALVLYAVALALLLSACDRIALQHRRSFAAIIPLGVALGEVVGFARGETSVFVMLFALYSLASWMMIRILLSLFAFAKRARGLQVRAHKGTPMISAPPPPPR